METYTQRIRREAEEEGGRIGLQEGRLEERCAIVNRMVRDKGLSFDVVADLYGISVDEVRSCVFRGMGTTSQSPL